MNNETPTIRHGTVSDRLARIETKLDASLEKSADQEGRLRSLEKKQWLISGGFAAIVFFRDAIIKLFRA